MGISGVILSVAIGVSLWLMILAVLCTTVKSLKAIMLLTFAIGIVSFMVAALIYLSEPNITSPSRGGLLT